MVASTVTAVALLVTRPICLAVRGRSRERASSIRFRKPSSDLIIFDIDSPSIFADDSIKSVSAAWLEKTISRSWSNKIIAVLKFSITLSSIGFSNKFFFATSISKTFQFDFRECNIRTSSVISVSRVAIRGNRGTRYKKQSD